jgi:hypothetical protein
MDREFQSIEPSDEDKEFWQDIIYNDGRIDEEQVMKELCDYRFVMQQASKVYDHVTGGKLSKIMYKAETIIAEADDLFNKTFEENMDEYLKDKTEELQARERALIEAVSKPLEQTYEYEGSFAELYPVLKQGINEALRILEQAKKQEVEK